MNLASLAIRYRTVVVSIVLLLTAWGITSFYTMPRREDPEFTIRTCVVSTSWPGAPTVKVEELITDKLEEKLDGIEQVDRLRSTTIDGRSTIYVDLEDNIPPSEIPNVWDKVRAQVELVEMPTKDIRPKVNDEFGDTAVLVLAVYQKPLSPNDRVVKKRQYSFRELEVYADRIRDVIRVLPGVAKAEKFGVRDEAIYIETDLGTWSKLGLTTQALRRLVEERNIVAPGGRIDTEAGRFTLKPGGEFNGVEEIDSIVVGVAGSGENTNQVHLRDLGLSVDRRYVDPAKAICRFSDSNGSYPAVMLAITMKSGSNIIDICERSKDRITQLMEIEQALPGDLAVTPVSDQSENVSRKISDVISNVVSAIVIVVIVVFLFVGFRTSIVMAANIPVVVLGSLAIITLFGVQLEQISLASIIIALGLLVDNAVQVCDQTRTNILAGMRPTQAAIEGANTLALPMLSGTITTVAAFFPMLIALEGGGKEYVYSLPVTLSTTLLLSWILAMTFCVILSAAFIRVPENRNRPGSPLAWALFGFNKAYALIRRRKNHGRIGQAEQSQFNPFVDAYGIAGRFAVRFKWLTITASVIALVVAVNLDVKSEFFPQDRRDQFSIAVVLPDTATISQTNQKVLEVEQIIRKLSKSTDSSGTTRERLRAMRSMIGTGGSRWALGSDPPSPASNVAEILVRTTDGELTPQFFQEFRDAVQFGRPDLQISPVVGARVIPKQLSLGPPAAPFVLRISGDGFADIATLRSIAKRVEKLTKDQPETWDVHDSWGIDGFQLHVDVDEERANLAGVSNTNVADTLNAYFSGLRLSTFREQDHLIPVYFRLKPAERDKLSTLRSVFIEGENGKQPLNSIASIRPRWQPAKIERRNLNRTIEIRSEIFKGYSGNDVVNRVMNSDRMKSIISDLPNGYAVEIGGSLEESKKSSGQMMNSFGISFLIIALVLILQYNGWSKPIVILSTLPLAMIGALFGLWLTNNAMGFMPQLGLLSLFGIVLNTGIIFIEFADSLVRQKIAEQQQNGTADGPLMGLNRAEFWNCLVEAGKQRMLPIFLTTATTIGGLVPLAFSGGPLWEGMAWLMIWGLVVATLLTLFVVPALYSVLVETLRINPVGTAND